MASSFFCSFEDDSRFGESNMLRLSQTPLPDDKIEYIRLDELTEEDVESNNAEGLHICFAHTKTNDKPGRYENEVSLGCDISTEDVELIKSAMSWLEKLEELEFHYPANNHDTFMAEIISNSAKRSTSLHLEFYNILGGNLPKTFHATHQFQAGNWIKLHWIPANKIFSICEKHAAHADKRDDVFAALEQKNVFPAPGTILVLAESVGRPAEIENLTVVNPKACIVATRSAGCWFSPEYEYLGKTAASLKCMLDDPNKQNLLKEFDTSQAKSLDEFFDHGHYSSASFYDPFGKLDDFIKNHGLGAWVEALAAGADPKLAIPVPVVHKLFTAINPNHWLPLVLPFWTPAFIKQVKKKVQEKQQCPFSIPVTQAVWGIMSGGNMESRNSPFHFVQESINALWNEVCQDCDPPTGNKDPPIVGTEEDKKWKQGLALLACKGLKQAKNLKSKCGNLSPCDVKYILSSNFPHLANAIKDVRIEPDDMRLTCQRIGAAFNNEHEQAKVTLKRQQEKAMADQRKQRIEAHEHLQDENGKAVKALLDKNRKAERTLEVEQEKASAALKRKHEAENAALEAKGEKARKCFET